MIITITLLLIIMVVILAMCVYTVRPVEKVIIERFGKFKKITEQGIHFKIPFIDKIIRTNITEQMVDAQAQEVITSDNLNATVDAQIYFKVKPMDDAIKKARYNVDDFEFQIVNLARTTLRNIIGQLSFREVNSMREKLNQKLKTELDEQVDLWGISIVRTELKEIEPPKDVQETMNKVLKAENEKIAAKDFATAVETQADGEKRKEIKVAEGKAIAIKLEANAQAEAIKSVNESANKYFVGNAKEYKQLLVAENSFKDNSKIIVTNDSNAMNFFTQFFSAKKLIDTKEKKKAI